MRTFYIATLALLVAFSGMSQDDKKERKSPPANASGAVGSAKIQINYSQPAVNGRTIWGELVPYGKIWRTGANEATTIEFSEDVKINGQALKAGKYSLFTIPDGDAWQIIFNKDAEQWGAYKYDQSKDALRIEVEPTETKEMQERLTFTVNADGKVVMHWEKLKIQFQVSK